MRIEYGKYNSFLIPGLLIVCLIWILPFFFQIGLSFVQYDLSYPDNKGQFIGLDNYVKAISQDHNYQNSLKVTVKFTFIALVIQIFLGLVLAVLIDQVSNFWRNFYYLVLIIPVVLAPFIVGLIWAFQFNPSFGPFSYFVKEVGLLDQDKSFLDYNHAFKTICFVDIWQNTPFITLIFLSALSGIPRTVKDSLKIHDVSFIKTSLKVYVKYILPIFIVAVFLRLIGLIKSFDAPFILTQGGPSNITELYSINAYRVAFKFSNFGLGSAEGLIVNYSLLILVIIILKKLKFYKL